VSFSRERQRLERAFHAILLALSALVASLGCTSRPPATRDAGMDQGAPPPVEAGLDGCTATEYQIEAGHDAADAQDTCGFIFSCGLRGTGLIHQGCTVLLANDGAPMPVPGETCLLATDAGCEHDALAPGPGGALTVLCTPCPGGIGRRPVGLQGGAVTRGQGVGAYLARMAFEESAAVTAFERMHEELVALGAPRVLVRAAKQAAQDERRHARVVSRLAKARGGSLERTPLG
jgi:hypothetical protein